MTPNPNLVRPDRETLVRLTSTMNDREISRMFGCTSPVIAKWRDQYGIPRSQGKSLGNVKWQTNRDYFARIDTPEKAYILGFIIADGHIAKSGYKVSISVKEADAGLLRMIADAAGCEAPLGETINHLDRSRMARLFLCGTKIVSDLNALGVYHDKTVTATYPVVPSELERDLVRGIWDGDGYIGGKQMELIGTSALLDGVGEAVQRHTGCTLRRRMSGRDRKYHYLLGSRRDAPVLHWMYYPGATIALARKREAASMPYWS